ncbi:MAG: hypothetical protein RL514_2129 [Verrucomicrobiota bacterium]
MLPPSVAGIKVMPVRDVVLGEFPAEKDFATGLDGGEIYEAAFEVLDLDLPLVELGLERFEGGEVPDPLMNFAAAEVVAFVQSGRGALLVGGEVAAKALELVKPEAELGQEGAGLGETVVLGEATLHGGQGFAGAALSFFWMASLGSRVRASSHCARACAICLRAA